ncbi:hypothetical protein QZJ86_19640 [Methylomonas montana]|uniref:hypothetical protein n=1 Tax=Methylomonas montana TaxID=3058963 RepID=UPI002658716B|nr:hypothetical protein [Methylomonas montana]WKJ90199.1 hypothetical protein QZJ86_19640 [Methylomonas montana]
MDYTAILEALNKASLFDLHRLQSAIYQELINPVRVEQVNAQLKAGQSISYFDPQANGLIDAVILKIQKTRCLVRNVKDQKNWNIPFYYLNLDDVDTALQPKPHTTGIPKSALQVGTRVGFRGRDNHELFGEVIRLNPKRPLSRSVSSILGWCLIHVCFLSLMARPMSRISRKRPCLSNMTRFSSP